MSRVPTPGQTVGPFFGFALPYLGGADLVSPGRPDAVRLFGRVLDGRGQPVPDALVEIRQAGPDGTIPLTAGSLHRDGWTFTGWGRAGTDAEGRYTFTTVLPAAAGGAAAFLAMAVVARGLTDRLFTRVYLPGDAGALERNPLLAALPPDRRSTLLARREDGGLRFDVVLQGEDETVFLAYPRTPSR
jgi:protocatechuate 3,4-dioxygenase alpha subunit